MTERNRGCDWEQLNRRYQLLTPIALRSFEGLSEESGSEGRSQGKVIGKPGILSSKWAILDSNQRPQSYQGCDSQCCIGSPAWFTSTANRCASSNPSCGLLCQTVFDILA
jgi:hypothetical protein